MIWIFDMVVGREEKKVVGKFFSKKQPISHT